jgi:hypothetical protein
MISSSSTNVTEIFSAVEVAIKIIYYIQQYLVFHWSVLLKTHMLSIFTSGVVGTLGTVLGNLFGGYCRMHLA